MQHADLDFRFDGDAIEITKLGSDHDRPRVVIRMRHGLDTEKLVAVLKELVKTLGRRPGPKRRRVLDRDK